MMRFITTEDGLDKQRTLALHRSRERQQWLLYTGAGVSFLLTLGLVVAFSRGIARRLAALADNSRRVARGEELRPPLQGSDEVAQLDQDFRRMAQEIAT